MFGGVQGASIKFGSTKDVVMPEMAKPKNNITSKGKRLEDGYIYIASVSVSAYSVQSGNR